MPQATYPTTGTLGGRREELGKDQTDIAEEIGTTQATVSRWENGSQFPRDPDTRKRMMVAYACRDLDELFGLIARTQMAAMGVWLSRLTNAA